MLMAARYGQQFSGLEPCKQGNRDPACQWNLRRWSTGASTIAFNLRLDLIIRECFAGIDRPSAGRQRTRARNRIIVSTTCPSTISSLSLTRGFRVSEDCIWTRSTVKDHLVLSALRAGGVPSNWTHVSEPCMKLGSSPPTSLSSFPDTFVRAASLPL